MNENINLLRSRQTGQILEKKKTLVLVRRISMILLLVVSFVSLLVFFLTTRYSLSPLKNEEGTLLSSLSKLHPRAVKLLLIENRVKEIAGIVEKKSSFDKTIDMVMQIVPQNVSVTSFILDKKNVVMTVTSSSLSSIDTMFSLLESAVQNKNAFSKVTLDSLSVDIKTSFYIVSLSFDTL